MAADRMASISEKLQEPQQQRIQKLAKAFGQKEAEEHGEIDASLCFVIISISIDRTSINLQVGGDRVNHVGFGKPKRMREILFDSIFIFVKRRVF